MSELCLGTMTFGASKEASRKMFQAFVEADGNFIDTANRYTEGVSEHSVGEFITDDRERIVLATKYLLSTRKDHPNASGNQRKNMVHAWDFLTPVEEVMHGLDDLVRAGNVLYGGIFDTPAWVVAQANTLAAWRGWTPCVGVQIEYSLLQRDPERDLLPIAQAFDLAILAWPPLAGGLVTGEYQAQHTAAPDEPRRMGAQAGPPASERTMRVVKEVLGIADEIGCTPAQVALNWLRHQVILVSGSRKVSQVQEHLDSLKYPLTPRASAAAGSMQPHSSGIPP